MHFVSMVLKEALWNNADYIQILITNLRSFEEAKAPFAFSASFTHSSFKLYMCLSIQHSGRRTAL